MHHVPDRCAPFGRCPWTDVVVHAPRPRCRTSGKGVRFQRSGCRTANGQGVVFGRHIQHFIPTWDEVDFQKIEALSCVQFVRKQKAQPFNFYTNYVEVIFVFLFPTFLTLCQVGTKFFTQLGMKLYPSIATFVTCGRVAHKTSRQFVGKWIATHHINNQRQLLPCFHFFVYGKLNFYANCAEDRK